MSMPLKIAELSHVRRPPDRRAVNALKTGVFSKALLLPDEDEGEREELEAGYREHFKPQSQPEMDVIREIVSLVWRRRRIEHAEQTLAAQAVRESDSRLPSSILNLAVEVHRQNVENGILRRHLKGLEAVDGSTQKMMLIGLAPVIDLLLGQDDSVADMDPVEAIPSIQHSLEAHKKAVEDSRKGLQALVEAHEGLIRAVRAEAALLDPAKADRLRRERVSIDRAIERNVDLFKKMRGWTEIEARFTMSGDPKTVFAETKSRTPGNGGTE